MDLQRFQTYHRNKIDPSNMASINTKDHSAYIEVAWADPGSLIRKSLFSVEAYCQVLNQKGGDISRFEKEVESMFKKGPRGSQAPDTTKVPIKRVMLVCQCENGINGMYSDSAGFGHPWMMGLWDQHSSDALNRAKMQLPSGSIDANFCPCCTFYPTNNETLNNHVREHYGMGLTCRSDGFTTASMAAMKGHMETEYGYEGKCAGALKTQEYMAAVVKAREERNAAHALEQGARRQALKENDQGDPVVRLLGITREVAHAQYEEAVDAFLSSIEKTL